MEHEYHNDHFQEHRYDTHYLAADCHIQENTENMQGKQRDDYRFDQYGDNFLEVIKCLPQCITADIG